MKDEPVHAQLLKFVEALLEDGELRAWFESFEPLAPEERGETFLRIAARMQAAGEHPELIEATSLLAREENYEGVRRTISGT
ncbi:MAG: hypothetical protein V4710_02960 [Verrucomicrobiota bacterium]